MGDPQRSRPDRRTLESQPPKGNGWREGFTEGSLRHLFGRRDRASPTARSLSRRG